jgi:hypothetical protein
VSVLIQSCIVCDLVRPEMNGKLIILGFLGVCPHVDIRLARLDRPTPLTFLLSGHMGSERTALTVEVVHAEDLAVVAATAEGQFDLAGAGGNIQVAPTLLLTFGRPGAYLVRCLADGAPCYAGTFRVSQGEVSGG